MQSAMYPMFVGPPGSGKGTQAELLARRLQLPHISAGALLRAAAAQQGSDIAGIRDKLANGEIIKDPFVMELIASRLSQPDCAAGAILDGCVRTLEQAVELDDIMAPRGGITHVIVLHVPDRVAAARLVGRYPSPETGEQGYAGDRRSDDTAIVIPKRQFFYRTVTAPVIEYYRARMRVIDINGDQPISAVHQQIALTLGLLA